MPGIRNDRGKLPPANGWPGTALVPYATGPGHAGRAQMRRRSALGLGLGQLVDALLEELLIGAKVGQLVGLGRGKPRQQHDRRGHPANRRHAAEIPLSCHRSPAPAGF